MEEETIAKSNARNMGPIAQNSESATMTPPDITNCEGDESNETNCEVPEMPGEMMGGPMDGGFPGETTATVAETVDPWLAPMVGAGITSGVVVVATAIICWMIFRLEKKIKHA